MRTHTVRRSRLVPHTVDGHTELILERYDAEVPQPPRDWDRIVRTSVTCCAALLVTVSLGWSTASIGALLDRTVIAPAAYGAALAFDVTWITCMAVEWLFRYDRRRARLPRRAGHVALLIAMGAIFAHGWLDGQEVVGAVGAVVSGLAKGGWTVVMSVHSRPLDDRTRQWVEKRRAALDAQLALVAVRRDHQRAEGLVAAEAAALGGDAPPVPERQHGPLIPVEDPDAPGDASPMREAYHDASLGVSGDAVPVPLIPRVSPHASKKAAILAAAEALGSGATPASIAHLLAREGLAVDTAHIRTVLSREARKASTSEGGGR